MTRDPEPVVPYAELHAHSAFSFLDGANTPAELMAEARRLGLEAIALTDHNGFYGVVQFAQAAKEQAAFDLAIPPVRTVFGAELSLDQNGPLTGVPDPDSTHLLVLASGPGGYHSLSRAIAEAHLATGEKGKSAYNIEDLGSRSNGDWVVLSGCRKGPVLRALTSDGIDAARLELEKLIAVFGRDHVFVELTDHGDPFDSDRNDALWYLAQACGVPAVATGNVHYARPRDYPLATAMSALRARRSLDDMDGWLPASPSGYLRSGAEMARLFARYPGVVARAAQVGESCSFDLDLVAPDLPPCDVPPGHTEATWLRELTYRGAQRRYGPRDNERIEGAYTQIDHELTVIEELHFPGYFLIVHAIVDFCRQQGILCQGRGSAANSAVCFSLGITGVDPVAHGLFFERFLAPERDGPPDIDVDIESGRREEVIQFVYAKYDREHSAQVANVISYRPRSAVRDAARALGYDIGQQDAWSKQLERWGSIRKNPDAAYPEHSMWGTDEIYDKDPDPDIPDDVVNLAESMMKLPRHLGIHSGGMVLCDRPVIEVCPVEWARMPGRTVLQWDKDDCADAGLVKFDLLGLGMLSAIRFAFEWIEEFEGVSLDLGSVPPEDDAVYDLLCAADTVGVFQVESRAQMATLPRIKPRRFYDLVIEVALIRPGPIQGGAVHPYIARRNGVEPIKYPHAKLEKSLERTLGIPLFQEQLMQMAVDIADFTPAEADQLRRAMGSKRSAEKMEAMRVRLFDGMKKYGIEGADAEDIFNRLKAFSDFGFPESHSYSFAHLVYVSAWLKVYHPAAFYAGLLAAQPLGFYSPQTLVADARRHDVETLRPDILRSAPTAQVERKDDGTLAVRMGLASVRTISTELAEQIVADRTEHGPFTDLTDFARRIALGTERIEALATAGALDGLGTSRRGALWAAGALGKLSPDHIPGLEVAGTTAPMLPGMSDVELAVADVWATGVSTDSFPTQFLREDLRAANVVTIEEILASPHGRYAQVAGVVTHRQRPGTARGVTFLSLEDETGLLNVVCHQNLWVRFRAVARGSAALVVRGRVERNTKDQLDPNVEGQSVSLVAEHLSPLSLRVASRSRDFR